MSRTFLSTAPIGLLLVALLGGCGASGPVGAPPFDSSKPIGANEQMPGATLTTEPEPDPEPLEASAAPVTALTERFACPEPTETPADATEFETALKKAEPGDVIYLEAGKYIGNFDLKAKGTAEKPIFLCGAKGAVLQGPSRKTGYVLHLDGAEHWRLSGFAVQHGLKGILLDEARTNALQDLQVTDIGDEGVHLRAQSSDNVLRGLRIHRTGAEHPEFGEGIYVGSAQKNWCLVSKCKPDRSDGNQLLDNNIATTTSEAIDVKEGTSYGLISGNFFNGKNLSGSADSWVDIKGNNWIIRDNRGKNSPKDGFQTHVILEGWGDGNLFIGNQADLNGGSGLGFYLHEPLRNKVFCDNGVSGAGQGISNVPCRG